MRERLKRFKKLPRHRQVWVQWPCCALGALAAIAVANIIW